MSFAVFLLVLSAAAMHAAWNAMVRVGGDRFVTMALVMGAHSAFGLAMILFLPLPAPAVESWPFILASVLIHQAYYVGVVMQYRFGDLSYVYPVARGISPLLVTLIAWPLAGEVPSQAGFVAIVVITAGILLIAGRGLLARHDLTALMWSFFTGACITAYTLTDGMGGRAAGNALSYVAWLFLFEGLPLLLVLPLIRPWPVLRANLRKEGLRGFAGGILSTAAYGVVIWAMSQATMGYVSAVRETSVVMAAAIGAFMLREPFGARRIAAAALVAAGAALLQLQSALAG